MRLYHQVHNLFTKHNTKKYCNFRPVCKHVIETIAQNYLIVNSSVQLYKYVHPVLTDVFPCRRSDLHKYRDYKMAAVDYQTAWHLFRSEVFSDWPNNPQRLYDFSEKDKDL